MDDTIEFLREPGLYALKPIGGVTGTREYLSTMGDGSKVDLYCRIDPANPKRQYWQISPVGGGLCEILVAGDVIPADRKYLSTVSDGTMVDLFTRNDGSGRQLWKFTEIDRMVFTIEISGGIANDRKYLSVNADGSVVDLWPSDDGSGRQRWQLLPMNDDAIMPPDMQRCAKQGEMRVFDQAMDLAYGAKGIYNFRNNVKGAITFDDTTFDYLAAIDNKIGYARPHSVNKRTGWMQDNLGTLAPLKLREICMPGTHDSGMSFHYWGTIGATAFNTVTQTLCIADQLAAGVRFFDIRPAYGSFTSCAKGPEFRAAHLQGQSGAAGEAIDDIIAAINYYTLECKEVIIVYVSHLWDFDNARSLSAGAQTKLFDKLATIRDLFVCNPPVGNIDLSQMTIGQLTHQGTRAAVLLVFDPDCDYVDLTNYKSKGFYRMTESLPLEVGYTRTDNVQTMMNDQQGQMRSKRTSVDSKMFGVGWYISQVRWDEFIFGKSLIEMTYDVNCMIFSQLAQNTTKTCYPNILHINNATDDGFMVTLSLSLVRRAFAKSPVGEVATVVAVQNQSCNFVDATELAYGAKGMVFRRTNVKGSVTFEDATFGDPLPGVAKSGYRLEVVSQADDVSSAHGAVGVEHRAGARS